MYVCMHTHTDAHTLIQRHSHIYTTPIGRCTDTQRDGHIHMCTGNHNLINSETYKNTIKSAEINMHTGVPYYFCECTKMSYFIQ